MTEEQRYETVTLHSAGPIPGIPGNHAPGTYTIDWQERTITPVQIQQETRVEQKVEEATPPTQPEPIQPAVEHQEAQPDVSPVSPVEETQPATPDSPVQPEAEQQPPVQAEPPVVESLTETQQQEFAIEQQIASLEREQQALAAEQQAQQPEAQTGN